MTTNIEGDELREKVKRFCRTDEATDNLVSIIEAEYSKREQALADLIIGEDETYEGHQMVWSIEHRNQLRAEQRKHLVNVQEIRHEIRRQTLHTS